MARSFSFCWDCLSGWSRTRILWKAFIPGSKRGKFFSDSGCAVALAEKDKADEFVSAVADLYKQGSDLEASIYVCKANGGCSMAGIQ